MSNFGYLPTYAAAAISQMTGNELSVEDGKEQSTGDLWETYVQQWNNTG